MFIHAHTRTHTRVYIYRTPRSSIFLSPNPSLSHPHPPTLLINSSHPFSLSPSTHPHAPHPSSRETHFSREGGIERKRDGGGKEGWGKTEGEKVMHSSSLLCCHSSLATEAFDVLQISNFIIENPLLLPSPPLPHPPPPPSLSALALKQAFLPHSPKPPCTPPPLNAEVKKLKALQKRLFVWVNYSLGCACMCQMYVCVRLYVHASVGESCAGSGVE